MSTPSASEEPLALRLSDTQLDDIMRLAQPLALHCRDALLHPRPRATWPPRDWRRRATSTRA